MAITVSWSNGNLRYLQHTSGGYHTAIRAQFHHRPRFKASSKLWVKNPTYCGRPADGQSPRDGAIPILLLNFKIFKKSEGFILPVFTWKSGWYPHRRQNPHTPNRTLEFPLNIRKTGLSCFLHHRHKSYGVRGNKHARPLQLSVGFWPLHRLREEASTQVWGSVPTQPISNSKLLTKPCMPASVVRYPLDPEERLPWTSFLQVLQSE